MAYKKIIATLGMVAAGSLALANPAQTSTETANVTTAEAMPTKRISDKQIIVEYAKTLEEISEDGAIEYKEAVKLHDALEPYFGINNNVTIQEAPLQSAIITTNPNDYITKTIEEKILINYPGLVNKPNGVFQIGIAYPSTQKLRNEDKKVLTDLLAAYPENPRLQILKENSEWTVVELAKVYTKASSEEPGIIIKPQVYDSTVLLRVKKEALNIDGLKKVHGLLDDYLRDAESYKKYMSKFIGTGLVIDYASSPPRVRGSIIKTSTTGMLEKELDFQLNIPLENRLGTEGIPKKGYFPWLPFWATLPLGFILPTIRLCSMLKWTGRKFDPFDLVEVMGSSFLGPLLIDSIHPLVYPIRIFGPILFEPIRKAMGWQE